MISVGPLYLNCRVILAESTKERQIKELRRIYQATK